MKSLNIILITIIYMIYSVNKLAMIDSNFYEYLFTLE